MPTPSAPRPIALVGLSGAGKSTLAPLLATRLATTWVDLDAAVEAHAGRRIHELFAAEGEPAFRRRERSALDTALGVGAGVIACGGGIVETAEGRERLRDRCRVVRLEVAVAEASARVGETASLRPLMEGAPPADRLATLLARRAAWYAEVAVARVSTDGLAAEAVVERVVQALEAHAGARGQG